MSPITALALCILFILYLLWLDLRTKPNVSNSLWIPLVWLLIISSRMVSLWFFQDSEDYTEGNPVDPYIFSTLIVVGLFLLVRRRVAWGDIFRQNVFVVIYFAYCAMSILWSDYPDIAFKRYIKAIGSLIMILIVVTETAPVEAIRTIFRRSAYILIPLSIILYKYYPHLGRIYHRWSGELMITGVTTHKNSLGVLCLACSIIIFSDLLSSWRNNKLFDSKNKIILFIMIFWLLIEANSATAILCFIISTCMFIGFELSVIKNRPNYYGYFIIIVLCTFVTMELAFDVIEAIFSALGRDTTLTGRTDIWKLAMGLVTNPLTGTGFESFWLGNRSEYFSDKYWFQLTEAHSGYLEVYLEGGIIGLSLLAIMIINGFRNVCKALISYFEYGKLVLVFFIIALIHNVTESSFRPLQLMGFIFFLSIVRPPKPFKNVD